MSLNTGVYFTRTTAGRNDCVSFIPGSTKIPACSPTKAPLCSSLQQNVQPSLTQQSNSTYWALWPSAVRASTATVAALIANQHWLAVHGRQKWRSWDHGFFSVPAARVGPLLKSVGATRIQGLLSTAVLQQHSILDLHTAEALHQSGDSTVDATDPPSQSSCS